MSRISTENAALKFLLSVVAIRTAPKTQAEICAGSNQVSQFREGQIIGHVLYMNPDDLEGVGLPRRDIQKLHWRPGYTSLVIATPLIPKGGCIFAPLNQAVLDLFDQDLHVDDFPEWTHSGGKTINAKPEPKALIGG